VADDTNTTEVGIDPSEKAAPGGPALVTGALGPATRVTQVLNNAVCSAQAGGKPIAAGPVSLQGGRIHAFFNASGWSGSGSQALAAALTIGASSASYARVFDNPAQTHLALIRRRTSFGYLQPNSSAPATITAGTAMVTDSNDRASLTVLEMGSPAVWQAVENDIGSPDSSSQYTSTTFSSRGGYLLLCASATGYSTGGQAITGMNLSLDGTPCGTIQIFANQKNWHLAMVPADFLLTSVPSGNHTLVATPAGGTTIDANDVYALTIFEVMAPPTVLNVTQVMANATAATQSGGKTVGNGGFSSYGGTLIITAAASAYAGASAAMLGMSIQIDGATMGSMQGYANLGQVHLGLPGNDLVVNGIRAGKHTVSLVAAAGTVTDYNDRCSVTIIEVATTWP
jgi:hypothetical protein